MRIQKKTWVALAALMCAIYLSLVFVVSTAFQNNRTSAMGTNFAFLSALCVGSAVIFFLLLRSMYRHSRPLFKVHRQSGKTDKVLFAIVFFTTLLFCLVVFAAFYPGGITNDTLNQWKQAQTFALNDHHPVFHTLLLWLATKVCNSFPFIILMQQVAFALAAAYLSVTLRRWGYGYWVVGLVVYSMVIPMHTHNILMYAWKDTTMSILLLVFLSQMIHVHLSKGMWLQKRSNCLVAALLLAAITLVRHNAILFTAPLMLLWFLQYKNIRKMCICLISAFAVLVAGIKGPVYSLVGATSSPNNLIETVGLPMSILSAGYTYAPDELGPETYAFMNSFAPQEEFAAAYAKGDSSSKDFNHIKWTYDFTEKFIEFDVTPQQVLRMTFDTVKRQPIVAAQAFIELTELVWEPIEDVGAAFDVWRSDEQTLLSYGLEYEEIPQKVQQFADSLYQFICERFSWSLLNKLLSQTGILIIALLIAWFVSIKWWGTATLSLIVPVMIYNFGTMMLLSGNDYRFFHFNSFLTYPLVIVMLTSAVDRKTHASISILD